ncbi:hypothetical protein [Acaryochloris sp. CCMEE 5410]|uniref:hypothetical protein n=1 Tax=Acaryochloris sp. CCMEE 5410 TaxID=310037 RepID=UPI0021D06778|nr:hypothetical protein [Acaryochloris sp. CCMEE 5410]KAI9133141.1 hypothetical protein ON05_007295 [Acaryochloris sp. CCMEE 5410]
MKEIENCHSTVREQGAVDSPEASPPSLNQMTLGADSKSCLRASRCSKGMNWSISPNTATSLRRSSWGTRFCARVPRVPRRAKIATLTSRHWIFPWGFRGGAKGHHHTVSSNGQR